MYYNKKLKILVAVIVMAIIASVFVIWLSIQSDLDDAQSGRGKLEIIDGTNITLSNNGYSLNLKEFSTIGETQTCTFVFKNTNKSNAHTIVNFDFNYEFFSMSGLSSFVVEPNETFEYTVTITLIDYPHDVDSLPISIDFNTTYF